MSQRETQVRRSDRGDVMADERARTVERAADALRERWFDAAQEYGGDDVRVSEALAIAALDAAGHWGVVDDALRQIVDEARDGERVSGHDLAMRVGATVLSRLSGGR